MRLGLLEQEYKETIHIYILPLVCTVVCGGGWGERESEVEGGEIFSKHGGLKAYNVLHAVAKILIFLRLYDINEKKMTHATLLSNF